MTSTIFTDEVLAQNFAETSRFANDVVRSLGDITTLLERHEIRLEVLEKLARRPVTVKSSKLLVLTAMGVSAYAGYKYAEQKFKDEIQRLRDREINHSMVNHPAGGRQPRPHNPNEN